MASDRIVAVGLLTAADVALLGQGFRRLFPVQRDGDFAALLAALDHIELKDIEMSMPRAANEPSQVTAADGQVLVDGPGGIAITYTPEAARETGRRLSEASAVAATQTPRDED